MGVNASVCLCHAVPRCMTVLPFTLANSDSGTKQNCWEHAVGLALQASLGCGCMNVFCSAAGLVLNVTIVQKGFGAE